ncbi:NAD(P)-dependent alcohol dehydrogenase [Umezawaea sp.]|uniref:NAD(P)-dependent alcohol dehydrogenase n=1 Tax=Umezawaea sp. TaxID=1955258 RepID=UPI002ED38AF3
MRVAQFDSYGPPEVLYEARVPMPVVKPGEVLVRVHGVSVNGGELMLRSGKLRWFAPRRFPKRTGIDFAGVVVTAAEGVPGPRAGDHVWGMMSRFVGGSAAEYVAVRPRKLSPSPAGLDLVEAAALPAGTTAITALRDHARLKPGERLLVRGAAGGIGSIAVQLGRHYGAHVTGLAGAKNLDLVRELGAHEVFDRRATEPGDLGEFDVVLDTAGSSLPAYRGLLARGGRMVGISFDSVASVGYVLLSTVFGSRRVRFFSGNPTHALFAELTGLVEAGALRPVVDTVHDLADISAAHRALEEGGVRGKHVVRMV